MTTKMWMTIIAVVSTAMEQFNILVVGYSTTSCNDQSSCSSQAIADDVVNCMGYTSCYEATSIASSLWTLCLGNQACRYAATIESTDEYVNCDGYFGCYSAGSIHAARYISCRGVYSCFLATMSTDKGDSTDSYINCRGDHSCYGAVISNTDYLYCVGPNSCRSSLITDVNYIYTRGEAEIRRSNISGVLQLYAYGSSSLYHSNIYSSDNGNHNNPMEIYLRGWYSGNELKIYCNSGDICQIYCDSDTGCAGTEIYCFGDCTIYCEDESDYYQCPLVYWYNKTTTSATTSATTTTTTTTTMTTSTIATTSTTVSSSSPTSKPSSVPTNKPSEIPISDPITAAPLNAPNPAPSQEPSAASGPITTESQATISCDCDCDDNNVGISNNTEKILLQNEIHVQYVVIGFVVLLLLISVCFNCVLCFKVTKNSSDEKSIQNRHMNDVSARGINENGSIYVLRDARRDDEHQMVFVKDRRNRHGIRRNAENEMVSIVNGNSGNEIKLERIDSGSAVGESDIVKVIAQVNQQENGGDDILYSENGQQNAPGHGQH